MRRARPACPRPRFFRCGCRGGLAVRARLHPYLRVTLLPYRGRGTGGEDFHSKNQCTDLKRPVLRRMQLTAGTMLPNGDWAQRTFCLTHRSLAPPRLPSVPVAASV